MCRRYPQSRRHISGSSSAVRPAPCQAHRHCTIHQCQHSRPHTAGTSCCRRSAQSPQHIGCTLRRCRTIQVHTAGRQSCRRWAQCRRHTRRMCRRSRRIQQSTPGTPPDSDRAPCLDHTHRTRRRDRRSLSGMTRTLCGSTSAVGPDHTRHNCHRCRLYPHHSSHSMSWPRWACRRRRIRCMYRLSQQTQRHTGCMQCVLRWRHCPLGRFHTRHQCQHSRPHTAGTSCCRRSAQSPQHIGCTLRRCRTI